MVIFFLECNLRCLMTSDKDFLGKDSIDKFDALLFQIRVFDTDEKGKVLKSISFKNCLK